MSAPNTAKELLEKAVDIDLGRYHIAALLERGKWTIYDEDLECDVKRLGEKVIFTDVLEAYKFTLTLPD